MPDARRKAEGKPLAPTRPVYNYDRNPKHARRDARLTDKAVRVLGAIEDGCWGTSRECWVSNRSLAEQTGGGHPDTIRRALRLLEKCGYITVVEDRTKVRGQRIQLLYDLA